MAPSFLSLILLIAICFSMAAPLDSWRQKWGNGNQANALTILMGDSRRLFANQFFAKADAYFHSGYYPSMFDTAMKEDSHMRETSGETEEHEEHHEELEEKDAGYLGNPRDWIDRFGRNFSPAHHSHLEKGGDAREILPWLKLTAELDPQKVETYTVAAFWLRSKLGKVDEAESFLRDGLRANPDSAEILFELGKIYRENRKEPDTARNLLELALKKWFKQNAGLEQQNVFLYEEIVLHLARLEEEAGDLPRAIFFLEKVKIVSSSKEMLQKQIDELKTKTAPKNK